MGNRPHWAMVMQKTNVQNLKTNVQNLKTLKYKKKFKFLGSF